MITLHHLKFNFISDGERDWFVAKCKACPRELHLAVPAFAPC